MVTKKSNPNNLDDIILKESKKSLVVPIIDDFQLELLPTKNLYMYKVGEKEKRLYSSLNSSAKYFNPREILYKLNNSQKKVEEIVSSNHKLIKDSSEPFEIIKRKIEKQLDLSDERTYLVTEYKGEYYFTRVVEREETQRKDITSEKKQNTYGYTTLDVSIDEKKIILEPREVIANATMVKRQSGNIRCSGRTGVGRLALTNS